MRPKHSTCSSELTLRQLRSQFTFISKMQLFELKATMLSGSISQPSILSRLHLRPSRSTRYPPFPMRPTACIRHLGRQRLRPVTPIRHPPHPSLRERPHPPRPCTTPALRRRCRHCPLSTRHTRLRAAMSRARPSSASTTHRPRAQCTLLRRRCSTARHRRRPPFPRPGPPTAATANSPWRGAAGPSKPRRSRP